MKDIKNTIAKLEYLTNEVPQHAVKINSEVFSIKPAPGKWSQKEIMGHLCDSAINNLSRFIKAQYKQKPFAVSTYDQDDWVMAAHYNDMPAEQVLGFWEAANRNIITVIKNYTPEMLKYECFLEDGDFGNYTKEEIPEYTGPGGMRTLRWLIDDYEAHMEYHLRQIPELNIEL